MSFCTSGVLQLSNTIYGSVGSPSFLSIGYISGWVTDVNNLGDLNNKLSTNFFWDTTQASGPCVSAYDGDDWGPEESTVYALMYMVAFYESQALAVLTNGGIMWTTMAEGDTKISRSDPVSVAKQFQALRDSSFKSVNLAINNYNRRSSVPVSINAADLNSYPTP